MAGVPYWRLSAFYFAYLGALGAFAPYFAPYLETRGLSAWQIGVVMSLWYGSRVLAPSLWGLATARAARPILVLRAGAPGYAGLLRAVPAAARFCGRGAGDAGLCQRLQRDHAAVRGAHARATGRAQIGLRAHPGVGIRGLRAGQPGLRLAAQILGYGWLVATLLPVFARCWWRRVDQRRRADAGKGVRRRLPHRCAAALARASALDLPGPPPWRCS
ncbi:MAG: MFS transporter [Rhodanobacteraceae bacterium]|nr:MFS transporter [Rhodanobacteraceae bacterium]